MQTRDEFVAQCSPRWHELETLLADDRNLHALPAGSISRVATLYRSVCADLMRARALGCGSDVTGHLDAIAGRAHNVLYGPEPYRLRAALELVTRDFPRTLRKNWIHFTVSTLLFGLPLALGLAGSLGSPEFAYGVLPQSALEQAAESYSEGFARGRGEGEDSMMAGFYVYNNVGIAFRCFATGILLGIGSVFFLIYNGLVIGTVLGHVIASGSGTNILTFICGHGPFELTAIVIAGAGGLKMGWALIDTRGRTRLGSLRAQARELVELIVGAALMLIIAALIEGFWSPSSLPPQVKWGFSAVASALVALYIVLGGRGARTPERRSA
jgi:uncharacterized membrane protein SpoIIM required for sporulation